MSFRIPNRKRVFAPSGGEMITKQSCKAECDINNILSQFKRTGMINHVTAMRPRFDDLPDDVDYQKSLNTIIAAEQVFEDLPAKVRDHFENDPLKFLEAFHDPDQVEYLKEMGFLAPQEGPEPGVGPIGGSDPLKSKTPSEPVKTGSEGERSAGAA